MARRLALSMIRCLIRHVSPEMYLGRAALLGLLLAKCFGEGVENSGNSIGSAQCFDELLVDDDDLERTSRPLYVLASTQLPKPRDIDLRHFSKRSLRGLIRLHSF